MSIKLSSLSKVLQDKIIKEVTSDVYQYASLPIVSSRDLKGLLKDYLLTSNLHLTKEQEAAIQRSECFGVFIKNTATKKYEVLLAKMKHLSKVKKAILTYIMAEGKKTEYENETEYKEHLSSIATSLPLESKITCTRQGVNFLANKYRPLTTNLGNY